MRLSQTPPALISLLLAVLSQTDTTKAAPHLRGVLFEELGYGHLQDRRGLTNCGAQGQYTCTGAEACYTNAAQVAYCSVPNNAVVTTEASGAYAVYTTTYTETDLILRTSTYSSWYQVATTTSNWTPVASVAVCDTTQGQSSCGAICCASNQYCAYLGSCAPIASGLTSTVATTAATETSTYSAPLRPTSGGVSTTTISASTTVPFISPATASGSTLPIVSTSTSHKLSGGAIAGIVIGTIAAVILLLLICFCYIVKAGFDGLLALFGLGNRNRRSSRERVEITEERYSRHGSGTASRRDTHTGWFGAGGRPARVTETRKKKSSGFGGMGAVGAGLLGLAVILGLKRRHDKEMVQRERSDIGSSYYTDSFTGTSASSASSDQRTRESRHTRR